MKRYRALIIPIAILVFVTLCGKTEDKDAPQPLGKIHVSKTSNDTTLYISVDNYTPYIDKNLPHHGFLTQIVRESYKRVGIEIKLEYRPWKRVEIEIDHRDRISFAYIRSKERNKKWLFSEKIIPAYDIFITRFDKIVKINGLKDLLRYRIGVCRGWNYGKDFDALAKKHPENFEIAETYVQNLHKLLNHRIDALILDPNIAAHAIKTEFPPEKRKLFKLRLKYKLNFEYMHVVCARKYPSCSFYIKKFNQGHRLMTQDGTRKRILARAY